MTNHNNPTGSEYNLEAVFNLCAAHMDDLANDGEFVTGSDLVERFEDAHGLDLAEEDRDYLARRLDTYANLMDAYGPEGN